MKLLLTFILLMTGIPTFSQDGDSIYRPQHQEKVYLHFDQTAYFLEETIWFNAYVLDESNRTTDISRVLYVELVSPEGGVVDTFKGKIEDGACHGQLRLDSAYLSGYFEVRAYTRHMMNFGEDNYFSRVFPVYDIPTNGNYHIRTMLDRLRPDLSQDDNLTFRERKQKAKNAEMELPTDVQRAANHVIRYNNRFKPDTITCDSIPQDLTPGQKTELVFRSAPNSTFSLSVCAEESHVPTAYRGDIHQNLFKDYGWVERSYRALQDFNPQNNIFYAPEKGITVDGDFFKEKKLKKIFLDDIALSLNYSEADCHIGGNTRTDSAGRWSFVLDDFYGERTASLFAVRADFSVYDSRLRMHKWFSPTPRMFSAEECPTIHKETSIEEQPTDSLEESKQLGEITVTAKKRRSHWKETTRSLVHYSFDEEAEYFADHDRVGLHGGIEGFNFISQLFTRYYYPARVTRWMLVKQYDGDYNIPKGEIYDGIHGLPHNIKEVIVRTDQRTCRHYDYTQTGFRRNVITHPSILIKIGKVTAGIQINDGYNYEALERMSAGNLSGGPHLGYLVCFILYSPEEQKALEKEQPRIKLGPTSRRTVIKGFTHPDTFLSPVHEPSSETIKTDFRRTLYWNPQVKTDEQGIARITFYNNANCRSLHISAEGIGTNGTPIIYYNKEEKR